ncbi:hypothetical protein F2Q69_00006446 [Brassica cretica]|uniref:Uncharacterized protein n=1 Tax=Brassica cretica TaxID=69181 RepID=A0A8S9P1Q5_BRACR|nr:hypothetical protein F2Q69_00006446 [Brassica cretica]
MEGSPYRQLSFSRGKEAVPGTGPGVLRSGEPGYLLAGIQRPVFCLGSGGIQYLSNMSGSKGEEALAEYKRALEVRSVKKAAPKRAAPSETGDEVQFIRSNKGRATVPASSSKNKLKASGSTPKVSPSSLGDPAMVLANINTKAMSQLFHLGERMDDHASLKADLAALTSQLREEKDNVIAKEEEIKTLKLKVRDQDEAGSFAAAENVSLREQLGRREEEIAI